MNQSTSSSPTRTQKRRMNRMTSSEYESGGLTSNNVDGLQVQALKMELQRERGTVESLQADIVMLRDQLAQAEERFKKSEEERRAEGEKADVERGIYFWKSEVERTRIVKRADKERKRLIEQHQADREKLVREHQEETNAQQKTHQDELEAQQLEMNRQQKQHQEEMKRQQMVHEREQRESEEARKEMQRIHDEERRAYESRNENERKKMVNQADVDKSENQQRIEKERMDLERVIDGLKAQNAKALQDKENLQKEVLSATDFIQAVQEQCYEAKQQSLELLETLKDSEEEVDTLKAYIIDLKARIAVYIPTKGDPTDKKLAEYINNYPDRQKLKIMFMRESEGVYEFGSKRIMVKVERDKIQIKVGGGFLSIDEFIDQYTPVELEKLERRDPLRRFTERVAVQKTIASANANEKSPVRRPGSPTKSKKSPRKARAQND